MKENNKKNNNKEKASNKTMTKHRRYFNNIFWMLRQWWKSRIKCHKMYGSKKSTRPKEKAKLINATSELSSKDSMSSSL